MTNRFTLDKLLKWCKIVLLSLIGVWLISLCIIPRPDTFDVKCNSTKIDDWSYVEGEGLTIKFQGYDGTYNVKVTDKELDLDRMVKNNILDKNTCKVLSSKVK